jgi:ornithine cyclodeaminase/alanine dehydrogenase-like protein (mu-crystallin family)
MRIVSLEEVQARVNMPDVIEAMRAGFVDLGAARVVAPDEFTMQHPTNGDIHVKGAHIHNSRWMVFKIASAAFSIPGNHGCSIGVSAESGEIEVVVDDRGWLTEVRTAAAVALSVDVLARADAQRIAIIGTGLQAEFQLEAVRHVRNLEPTSGNQTVAVFSPTASRVHAFADKHDVRPAKSIDDAIEGAEIILCATNSYTPVLTNPNQFRPGVHITASGADMVGKHELGAELIGMAELVVVDDVELARRVGILQHVPEHQGREIVRLDTVLTGGHQRTSALQRTICGLSGLGMQDAAIFELAVTGL